MTDHRAPPARAAPNEPFGQVLRRLRSAAALSQEDLAERAGLSRNGISGLERGARRAPRLETVRLLADGLALGDADRAALLAAARPALLAEGLPASVPVNPHSLPTPLTRLIGRETELTVLRTAFLEEAARLLTLTGPGGVGKTRLALAAAGGLLTAYPDGVVFVDLSPLTDPELVTPTVAAALGVLESAELRIIDSLSIFLASKRLLLLLDNCERVLGAAPDLLTLLLAHPGLTIFATSREAFHLRGEREIPLPPLAAPAADRSPTLAAMARVPSVALFVERAAAIQPAFALTAANASAVAAICRRLDGLPLAIELAAARVKVLPPSALLARLEQRLPLLTGGGDDLPARQRTMRDTIAWSYDLLDAEEQRLWRRIAVFEGGCALRAVEAIAGTGRRDGDNVLCRVSSLVDKSVLTRDEKGVDEPRFAMLESLREYGWEQLAAHGEEPAARDAHAAYYLALAESAAPGLTGAKQIFWLNQLESERPNLRSALLWLLERDGERATAMAGNLGLFWVVRNHLSEGSALAERVLETTSDAPTRARAGALRAAGMMGIARGNYAVAASRLQDALAITRRRADRRGSSIALYWLGVEADYRDDIPLAETRYEEAVGLLRELDEPFWLALTLCNMGDNLSFQGDLDRAAGYCAESLDLARRLGNPYALWNTVGFMAGLELSRKAWQRAAEGFGEEMAIALAMGDMRAAADAVAGIAMAALGQRQFRSGVRLLAAADAWRERIGRGVLPSHDYINRATTDARARMGTAAFRAAWEAGAAIAPDQVFADARMLIRAVGADVPSERARAPLQG